MILNTEQEDAVKYTKGPLLIIAGAGTGKTRVIVEKIQYLIQKKKVKPQQILALTFTEKAASEMEERVDKILPYGVFQTEISTFHSFADKILREEITHIGLSPNYKLMTQAESVLFLRNNLFHFKLKYFRPLGNPHKFIEALLQHFSRLQDEDISPKDYANWLRTQKKILEKTEYEKYKELTNAYNEYLNLKVKEGRFDFSDLLYYVLQLFRRRPQVLLKYREQFSHILIDEFQDTNIAQYNLIQLLCPPHSNPKLTVVGDDSQAIYKFRGASVSNILQFIKNYKKTKRITLNKNYRSTQSILNAAHKLIKNNDPDTLEYQLGISKHLTSNKSQITNNQNSVSFTLFHSVLDEAEYAAKKITEMREKNDPYSNFAILVRAHSHADPFMTALARNGIPYRFLGPGMLFKQPEVKDLIAYLKFLYNPGDAISFYRVLTMEVFDIDHTDLSLLLSFGKSTSLSLFQAITVYLSLTENEISEDRFEIYKPYLPLLNQTTKTKLITIVQMVKRHFKLLKRETAGQITYYFLEDSGLLKGLTHITSQGDEKKVANIAKFFEKLKNYELNHEDSSIYPVVDYLDMSMELGDSPLSAQTDLPEYDAVNITTVHSAKGLEFDTVFLVNLSQGRFPSNNRKEVIELPKELVKEILPVGDYHLEEERRLFYVGMTRAKSNLFLSASLYYGEGKRKRKVSPFVIEALGENVVHVQEVEKSQEKLQLSLLEYRKKSTSISMLHSPPTVFSYSQLQSYATCPLQYKYQYVLRIPTIPSSSASFGSSIHKTLQLFYQIYMQQKSKATKDKLLKLLDNNWVPIGYLSHQHQEKHKQEAKKMLVNFFNTFHSKYIDIIALEKMFKIKISDDVFITGKIDRVDKKNDDTIEIVDYKTGKKPDEKSLHKSIQLSIYALAATDKQLYNKAVEKIDLAFYYLQDMSKISLKKTESDLLTAQNEIMDTVDEIRKQEYLPKVGPWCDFCPFRMICEAWQ